MITKEQRIKELKAELEVLHNKEKNNSIKNNKIWIKTGALDEGLLKENDEVFRRIRKIHSEIYELEHIKIGVVG